MQNMTKKINLIGEAEAVDIEVDSENLLAVCLITQPKLRRISWAILRQKM